MNCYLFHRWQYSKNDRYRLCEECHSAEAYDYFEHGEWYYTDYKEAIELIKGEKFEKNMKDLLI